MKKITESQLKDKVNSLREYLKVYENQQVDEYSIFKPSTWGNGQGYEGLTGGNSRDEQRAYDATKNSTGGANMALVQNRELLAPGSVASETGSDGVTYAVDAKGMRTFKIENNKWVAMATPTSTENPELQGAAEPAAAVTPAPGAEATKIARFKELLAKAALTPQNDPGMKGFMGEGTAYFLNTLRLIESRQLNEVTLSPEEQKEMDSLYAELGNTEQPSPEVAELINQYNSLKAPAQAAAVTPAPVAELPKLTGPVTWKQIYDANKDVIGANPNLIKPGQQLKMPDSSTYTVKPGDNLSKIAKNAGAGQGAKTATQTPSQASNALQTAQSQSPEKLANLQKSLGTIDGQPASPAGAGTGQSASPTASTGIRPGQNARDDLLARQGKGQKTIDLSNSSKYTDGTPRVKTESVGYNELQRIVSLINHR